MTQLTPTRRSALSMLAAGVAIPVLAACGSSAKAATFKIKLTDAQWKAKLSPAAYQVLRHEDTERPFTSSLNNEHRTGTFLCAGCNNELYASGTKFDSGTGWPSFWKPLPGAIGTLTDHKLGYARNAVYCADCGGHLGHVFDDGPKPTGLRYCMNGVAMKFRPA
ncbi:MAG: peptide-methionine (R)-S-oxide reductase MsrB [Croceibacterium sp.]